MKYYKKAYLFKYLRLIKFLPFFTVKSEREKRDDLSIIKSINSYKDKLKIYFINKKILDISLNQKESIFYWWYINRLTNKEKKLFKLIKTEIKRESTIIDVGAGLGLMSKNISLHNQQGLIYIEPNTIMFNLLIKLNSKQKNSIFIREKINSYEQFFR